MAEHRTNVEARLTQYLLRILCTLILTVSLLTSPAEASNGVVLNFNEVDISTMVKFISDLTGKNFILDERVKGKISVYSPSKLSTEEAYNVFTSVLELKGFTVVQSGKIAKIVPTSAAKQSGFKLLSKGEQVPVNESYIAQVSKMGYITPQEAMTFLQPMISKDGHLSAFGPGNLLLMVDSAINIRKLHTILQAIDVERVREGLEIVYLKNASAENTATTVRQWLTGSDGKSASPPGASGGSSASTNVMADPRLNALLVFGPESVKKEIRELVAKLDVAPPEAGNKLNIYNLENTDATEIGKVLDGVIKGMTAQAAPSSAGAAQASPLESGKITITADKISNSLVIMASPSDYNSLIKVIKRLDRRSKQVFVNVLIAEVSMDKSRNFGVQMGALAAGPVGSFLQGGAVFDPYGVTSSLASSFNVNLANSTRPVSAAALLQALDSNGLINILSTPNILTTDNKEAEISVGENVPFQGGSTLSSTGTTTSVERKDIGINLKIKPQISEGDYIRMDISQEISAVKSSKGQAIDLVTTKRAAKTSVIVKSGKTVVIGGLIQDNDNESVSNVPFLGDIPGLGWLFKNKMKMRTKTNLMILLTPNIVRDDEDMEEISTVQRIKFGEAAKKVEPVDVQKEINKQHLNQIDGTERIPTK